ncbi:MAG: tRNA lysidine(34) synthetase TilS, partial [Moraxellaceae bacterium]
MTHDLKKLLQASGILPWERERLPLVFSGGELMAVAGTSLRSTRLHEAVRFSLGDVTCQMEK